jgi:hypothetical protein
MASTSDQRDHHWGGLVFAQAGRTWLVKELQILGVLFGIDSILKCVILLFKKWVNMEIVSVCYNVNSYIFPSLLFLQMPWLLEDSAMARMTHVVGPIDKMACQCSCHHRTTFWIVCLSWLMFSKGWHEEITTSDQSRNAYLFYWSNACYELEHIL